MTELMSAVRQAIRPVVPSADEALVRRLATYVELLHTWNRRTNLTGFKTTELILKRGVADSLAALPLLCPEGPCADVGSGAGFPGLILAAALPDRPWTLLEPRRKRASFLSEAARVLGLEHVVVLTERLENTDIVVATVTSRAVGGLAPEIPGHLLPGGIWVLSASAEDTIKLQADGGYPGLAFGARTAAPAGGSWVRLEK